jgi:hypothetical protein
MGRGGVSRKISIILMGWIVSHPTSWWKRTSETFIPRRKGPQSESHSGLLINSETRMGVPMSWDPIARGSGLTCRFSSRVFFFLHLIWFPSYLIPLHSPQFLMFSIPCWSADNPCCFNFFLFCAYFMKNGDCNEHKKKPAPPRVPPRSAWVRRGTAAGHDEAITRI